MAWNWEKEVMLWNIVPHQIQLGGLGAPPAGPVDKWCLVHSELKIMLPVTALLQTFSENQVCIQVPVQQNSSTYNISAAKRVPCWVINRLYLEKDRST